MELVWFSGLASARSGLNAGVNSMVYARSIDDNNFSGNICYYREGECKVRDKSFFAAHVHNSCLLYSK